METISRLWSLVPQDLIKSIITSVFAGVIVAIAGIVSQPGFDLFMVDWGSLVHLIINVSVSAFVADIARRYATDSNGKLLGKI